MKKREEKVKIGGIGKGNGRLLAKKRDARGK